MIVHKVYESGGARCYHPLRRQGQSGWGTTCDPYLSARQTVWLCGYLVRRGWSPGAGGTATRRQTQSLVRLNASPSSLLPFCRDRWHRTHALARSQPLLPVSLPPSKVLPRRRPREPSRRCSYPAPGNRARNQADSAADGASQRFVHRRRRLLLQLVLHQTAPIRRRSVQLVPKILPPPPPHCSLESQIPPPRRPHGVALTNRRWPRPYRDCRVISPLLLFGLLGSALIWKIVAFWSAGGCATWTSSTRRRGGWSGSSCAHTHITPLFPPPSLLLLPARCAHPSSPARPHRGWSSRGFCWSLLGARGTEDDAGRLSRLID